MTLLRRIGFWLALTLSVLIALMALEDVIAVLVSPDGYPFGWEGGGWRYRTQTNYVVSCLAQGVPASLFIGAALVVRGRRPLIGCAFATVPIVLFLGWTIYVIGTLG